MTDLMNSGLENEWNALTDKQRALVKCYVVNPNKTQAYVDAYCGGDRSRINEKSFGKKVRDAFRSESVANMIALIQGRAIKLAFDPENNPINSYVLDEIDEIVGKRAGVLMEDEKDITSMQIDAAWVLRKTALIANFNIKKFLVIENGEARYDFSTATDDDWYCISEFSNDLIFSKEGEHVGNKTKLKAYDKMRALELVGKHVDIGAFRETVKLSGDPENPIQVITRVIVKKDEKS